VAHPVHQLPQASTSTRREHVPGVAQVVKADQRHASGAEAGSQTRIRKLVCGSGEPPGLVNTRLSPSGSPKEPMCCRTAGSIAAGMMTIRLPAADLDGAKANRRREARPVAERRVPSAYSGPHRRTGARPAHPPQAAENSEQHERLVALIDRIGQVAYLPSGEHSRSADFSTVAPLMRQGLIRISPSSAAVFRMALSSRYAFTTVTALTSA